MFQLRDLQIVLLNVVDGGDDRHHRDDQQDEEGADEGEFNDEEAVVVRCLHSRFNKDATVTWKQFSVEKKFMKSYYFWIPKCERFFEIKKVFWNLKKRSQQQLFLKHTSLALHTTHVAIKIAKRTKSRFQSHFLQRLEWAKWKMKDIKGRKIGDITNA